MSIKEVIVPIYVCSICKRDQEPDAEMTLIDVSYPGESLRLDVCPDCWNTNKPLATVLSFGESPYSSFSEPSTRAKSNGSARKPNKRAARAAKAEVKGVSTRDRAQLISCPEPGCDYGPKKANVIGVHRSRVHGYLSPRGKGRVAAGA